ncbi:MAG: autotransporter strand-loop-strand O-heptosyltransferase [Selenomonas sp.]|uniref:autotransporter strand-loop-strand O-heptosyltransferase n=1 Tax=Selenomonas sp. TaxID=2053611 RepID=UPI0025E3CC73|nr:autotransporter strand-loop-strand O-heptosyltransferase [Selenomonas sp.]MCR5756622.1 autotransporter strand-loop-strand O-heptosyltransferase [Selenomonas sp.]
MEMFPYPIQYFPCRKYSEKQQELMEENNRIFFNEMHVHMGAVAGDTGIDGLKLDFRNGLRLQVPAGDYHVRIADAETGTVYFDEDAAEVILVSEEKYYIPWFIEVFNAGQKVFEHCFDPTGQRIHIGVVSTAMGDTIAFLPAAVMFAKQHQAKISIDVREKWREFIQCAYPEIEQCEKIPEDTYAVFWLVIGFDDPHFIPTDGRRIPMRASAQYILGQDCIAPRIPWKPRKLRTIAEPYVCIGVQASGVAKTWQWPKGWDEIVAYLKQLGYRVLCIDRDRVVSDQGITVKMPAGAEDFTGNIPLAERADMLAHADFFIGLGSGLSWLAWMAGCPVIMLAGFSAVWYEFPEVYRVMNPRACNGCFNDDTVHFLRKICPRHKKDSPYYLECQRQIAPVMVKKAIDRCRQEHKKEWLR